MKLTEITLEQVHPFLHHRIGRLSDGVNIIEGQAGSGKTAIREFVRDTFLSSHRYQPSRSNYRAAYDPPRGQIAVKQGSTEFSLQRNWDQEGRIQATALTSSPIQLESIEHYLNKIQAELYDTLYSFSFKQSSENLSRLARLINEYFGVPVGSAAAGDDEAFRNWSRDLESRKLRLEDLRQQLERMTFRRSELVRAWEQNDSVRQSRLLDLDCEIQSITHQLNADDLNQRRNQLTQLDREIAELRSFIEETLRRESLIPPAPVRPHLPDPFQMLYLRLDEIDSQIRRWRRVQSDVQSQRVRLKDEMVVWGELTVESAEHPYHNTKRILVALEERINQTDQQAKQWELAPVHHTDPSQSVRVIQTLCQSMRHDLQLLSNELGTQFKSIRHRAAALELKQLRHCFNLMNENIERLLRRREQVVNEVKFLDPAGAEAIVRAELAFMQCALHEGYLEARRRFVGPIQTATELAPQAPRTDLSEARNRLHNLQAESNQLQRWLTEHEVAQAALKARLADAVAERANLEALGRSRTSGELAQLDSEIQRLSIERDELTRQIDAGRTFVKPVANGILAQAGLSLQQLTNGEWDRIWLAEVRPTHLMVGNRSGQTKPVENLQSADQQLVYVALTFACQRELVNRGLSLPTLIDDVSLDFSRERLGRLMQFFNRLQRDGVQLLLLTEHREIGKDVGNFARFVLPLEAEQRFVPPVAPRVPVAETVDLARLLPLSEVRSTAPTSSAPISLTPTSLLTTSPDVLNYWVDSGDIDPVTLKPFPEIQDLSGLTSYPSHLAARQSASHEYALPYPSLPYPSLPYPSLPNLGESARRSYRPVNPGPSIATPIAADSLGEPICFAPSFDDATELDRIELLDPTRLRALSEVGIDTVAQLLELTPEDLPVGLRERGVAGDQVDRWQAIVWLLSHVSGLRVVDAKILVACGVTEPEHLITSHPQQLLERIQRFTNSSEGQRYLSQAPTINLVRIEGWLKTLNASRPRWQRGSGFSRHARRRKGHRRTQPHPSEHPEFIAQNFNRQEPVRRDPSQRELQQRQSIRPEKSQPQADEFAAAYPIRSDLRPEREPRQPLVARPPRMQTPTPATIRARTDFAPDRNRKVEPLQAPANRERAATESPRTISERTEQAAATDSKLRFYLELKDHIEAAPSIGPKTAERFERIGVRTVQDFLNQTAESMATKLKYQRITADLIRAWQDQTRLVCRIPNLRGHDAQLLVACGYTEPEKISGMQPQRLLDVVLPFARSKEGLKIVRTGKEPDLQEVTDWIKWAGLTRSIHAA